MAACSDESLQLYNAKEGRHIKSLLSKKYGAHLARFTHHSQSIIYASTKGDDTIRYLSTHDNQFLRYFKGHTAPVTTLALCPGSDTFVSGSLDNTLRLWNLNSSNAQGRLNLATPTLACYDPSATVLAIGSPATCSVLLYDLRNYDKPPFATFDLRALDHHPHTLLTRTAYPTAVLAAGAIPDWTKLEFSNDGKSLLVSTNSTTGHLLLDAFDGSLRAFLVRPASRLPLSADYQRPATYPPATTGTPPGQGDTSFSADGRFVVGASGGDHDALVWDMQGDIDGTQTLPAMAALPSKTPVGVCEWNPRFNMLATGDRDVVFWLPDEHVGAAKPV